LSGLNGKLRNHNEAIMAISIKNYNRPKPKWAKATSHLLENISAGLTGAGILAGAGYYSLIPLALGWVAKFILELFPNEEQQQIDSNNSNNQKTEKP